MTTPNEELRRLATAAMRAPDSTSRLIDLERACTPSIILALLDQLQSLAERIKELELDLDVQAGSIEAVQAANSRLAAERDTLRAELADAELHTKQVERGLDKATAQLEAIAATEPVGYAVPTFNFDNSVIQSVQYAGTVPLFTRPMPAQDVNAELVEALEMALKLNSFREFNDHIPAMRTALSKYKGAK